MNISAPNRSFQVIHVLVPPSIANMALPLEEFVRGMVYKLEVNSHKNTPKMDDVPTFIIHIQKEVLELYKQFLEDRTDPNFEKELHDIANFAFLTGLSVKYEKNPDQMEMFNESDPGSPTAFRLDHKPMVDNLDD